MTINPYTPQTEQYRQWNAGYNAGLQGYTYGPMPTAAFRNGVLAAQLESRLREDDAA